MDALIHDLRYGFRQLWRSPAFTVAAVATLALGIGANTALFTLGNAILAKPLSGIRESSQLVWVTALFRWGRPATMSYPDFQDYRAGLADLVDLAAVADGDFALSTGGEPQRLRGQVVSGNYFSILRTPFALGRGFLPAEDSVGGARSVVVISWPLWQQRFNGDSSVIGKTVAINGKPSTIVGVTAKGFNGPDLELPRHVWVTVAQNDDARPEFAGALTNRNAWWIRPIGRMKAGVTPGDVLPAARTIASRIAAIDTLGHKDITARVWPATSGLPAGSEEEVRPLAIFSAIVTGLVLLIACANVSNLLLARAVARRREIAVRLSIGASRGRLVRQLFTESLMLAVVASVTGVLLAYWGTDWLTSSGVLPLQIEVAPDRWIIGFAVGAAVLAAILFGLVPALESTRGDVATAVREGAHGRDVRRTRLQSTFVVAQLALSLTLLTTAGLFLRSMYKMRNIDVGFETTQRILALSFDLGLQRYSDERAESFLRQIQSRAEGMPGVERVSFTDLQPLGNRYLAAEISLEEAPARTESARREQMASAVFQSTIRPGYFQTLGMRVVRGRDFTAADNMGAPKVVIVSDSTARQLWGSRDPIGRRLSVAGEKGPFLTVVGVVSNVMLGGPGESRRSTVYVPQLQYPGTKRLTMLVRTTEEPEPLAAALRAELRKMDADLPIFDVHTMAEIKEMKLADRANGARILGGFGGLALLLASIGVYGMMAFTVVQRTREIGIRIALGARGNDVVGLFVSRALRLALIGVAIGMSLALALSRLLQRMLFGLTPTDAATLVAVATLLTGVALLASWLPARRAARVDPMQALRYE